MNMVPILTTLFAGLTTVLGALFVRRTRNTLFGAFALSFATGIMLMVALGELLPEAIDGAGLVFALLFVVFGAFLSLVLDLVLPHHHDHEKEHEKLPGHYLEDCECAHEHSVHTGMIVALLLHNILEGLATGLTVESNTRLGINMALGIAIHNIPIGTTLAVSMISAGKSKKDAIVATSLVGLSQPFGAFLGTVVFGGEISINVLSICMAVVAGILVFISFDELWPAARKSGGRNLTIAGLLVGICFVPLTELLIG